MGHYQKNYQNCYHLMTKGHYKFFNKQQSFQIIVEKPGYCGKRRNQFYLKQIDEYITLGHARKLSLKEVETHSEITNYMPHSVVLNINKPKWTNTCLNSTIKALKQVPRILVWCLLLLALNRYFVFETNFEGI